MLSASKVIMTKTLTIFIEMLNEGRFGNHYTFVAAEHRKMLMNTSIDFVPNEIDL
jgi:hypothetical protein